MQLRMCVILVLITSSSIPATAAETAGVAQAYLTPYLTVPYARTKPVVDGVVDDREWQGAASVRALQTVRKQVSSRQTRWWIAWDEQNLYLAMRSPLRPGERPIQTFRGEGGDPFVIMDDCYEFYFDTGGTLAGDLPAYVQYIGNFAGEKYDAAHLPTVGVRRMSYEAGLKPRNRITERDGRRVWEMEVVVPRESVLVRKPLEEGMVVRALLARNYKRPWEQNSIEGASIFRNTATYSRMRLSRSAPAVHILGVADPEKHTIGLRLAAFGHDDRPLKWTFASDSGLTRGGVLDLTKGKLARAPVDVDLEQLEKQKKPGQFRIRVTSADGSQLYFDWVSARVIARREVLDQQFEEARGEHVKLSLILNPVRDYLRVRGDFINYDAREEIKRCHVTVSDAAGKQLIARDFRIDAFAFVRGVLQLPNLPPGKYLARMTCLDAAGKTALERETPFEKKDHAKAFDWWNTPHGSIERVITPWTPVTFREDTFGVWGRRMKVGTAGLPEQVHVKEDALLAGPVRLEIHAGPYREPATAGGSEVVSRAEHRIVLSSTASLKHVNVRSEVTVEFDGMYRVALTLLPEKQRRLNGLRLVVPFRPRAARYVSACGEGIRWGYDYRDIPRDRKGRIWDCRRVDGQRMALGSFIPYVWVGSPLGGLCWFADSDAGWVPSDKRPAIELQRTSDDSIDLVFNLISEPFDLDKPRRIEFAFQATPVKPLYEGWRTDVYDFRDTFQDWQCAADIGSSRRDSPVPWTFKPEKCREMVERWHGQGRILNTYRADAIPYGRHNLLFPRHMPEAKYFGEHWNSQGSWHIYYSKTLNDYWIHKLAGWVKDCGIDGYYSDNVRPAVCFNVAAGRGYRLPDGRVQPGYNMFGIRRYFLRVRAVFAEHGKHNNIVTHMTHNMVMPWLGACDLALDGEDHHIAPAQNRTWLDAWPLERLRATIPHQLGVAVTYKLEFPPPYRWGPGRYSYDQVFRSYAAGLMLHDAMPMHGWRAATDWFVGRHRFGIGAKDVTFRGYWNNDIGVRSGNKDVLVSTWRRPGRLLILAAGMQRARSTETVLRVDRKVAGLPTVDRWRVYDAERLATYAHLNARGEPVNTWEAGAKMELKADGGIKLSVAHHDYRLIVIEDRQAH